MRIPRNCTFQEVKKLEVGEEPPGQMFRVVINAGYPPALLQIDDPANDKLALQYRLKGRARPVELKFNVERLKLLDMLPFNIYGERSHDGPVMIIFKLERCVIRRPRAKHGGNNHHNGSSHRVLHRTTRLK